jgi:general secretion pathway protein F
MEIERLVTTAVRLFEPLMLVLMGVVVLTIVMSILMPIMEMNNMVGQ